MSPARVERVLSGMQPSGRLHLGNLWGALENWRRLQDQYDCYFFVADWHALSTNALDTGQLRMYTEEMLLDWLAIGLDPERATLFVQSHVPQHAALDVLLSMITPVAWLERNPTYKEQQQELVGRDVATHGFLGYPVLQAADVLIYKARYVPVGQDQVPHIELMRELARRFNHLYREVFPVPEALLTEVPKIPGVDGRKMSKSYHNTIELADSPEAVWEKLKVMATDPARVRRTDPGTPELCPVFSLHRTVTPSAELPEVAQQCRTASVGCLECKKRLYDHLTPQLEPIWTRREPLARRPSQVWEIVADGASRARVAAQATLDEAMEAVRLAPQ